jgi:hypothetical protein
MEEKQKQISKSQKMLFTVPIDIETKYRQEAQKREISLSDMFVKIIEERDYFERKLVEKDRIIENSTEKIHTSIVESLSEIKNTNLQLQIVSKSLSSIPQVTEEARSINERCTKSAEVIRNFNIVVSNVNKEIKNTEESIKLYNDVLKSNKSQITEVNSYISQMKTNTSKFLTEIEQAVKTQKSNLLEKFESEVNTTTKKLIDSVKINTFDLSSLFNSKIKIAFGVCVFLMFIMSLMFIYDHFNDVSKLKDDIFNLKKDNAYYKNMLENAGKDLCKYQPRMPGYNYEKLCK